MVANTVPILQQRFEASNLAMVKSVRGNNYADAKRTEAYSRQPDTMPNDTQMPTGIFTAASTSSFTRQELDTLIEAAKVKHAWLLDEFAKS